MKVGVRLILKDGTVIENGQAGLADGFLWLTLEGMTMQRAANLMLNPQKTARITFQYGEMETVYKDYTVCMILRDEGTSISACLVKE